MTAHGTQPRAPGHQRRWRSRAVDVALWDLKARLLGLPLATLLGAVHDAVPVYGSGGFTSYTHRAAAAAAGGWVEQGYRA